jgi:hypothetical protein
MKLLKDFEASDKHYRQSLSDKFMKKANSSSKNIYDVTSTYPNDAIKEEGLITEE